MCPPVRRPGRVDDGRLDGEHVGLVGRAGPAAGAASPAIVSSSVPATWIVPARRTSGLVQGTGSDRTQSILNTPGPCLYRDTQRGSPRSPGRRPSPRTPAGVVSSRTAGTPSNSRRSVTSCPVTTSPPCSSSAVTIASASFCEPPSTSGQPTWWASMPSSIPRPAVSGRARSSMPCAAAPASSACAPRVSKYRCGQPAHVGQAVEREVRRSAGRSAWAAGAAGWSGRSRRRRCRARPAGRTAGGRPPPSAPRPAAVSSSERRDTAARPPSSGWAKLTSGCTSRTPRLGRSNSRKNGAAAAIGCTVEQTSWR